MRHEYINDSVVRIYDENHVRLFRQGMNYFYGNRECIEDVEECIQDVFLDLYLKYESLASHEKIEAWLSQAMRYRLLKKTVYNKRKGGTSHRSLDRGYEQQGYELSVEDMAYDQVEVQDLIERMARFLPPQLWRLLQDHYLYHFSICEMAKARGTSPGTIRAGLSNARKKARQIIKLYLS